MFRKDQFGIVFNTIFSLMFAIFLPLYMLHSAKRFFTAAAFVISP